MDALEIFGLVIGSSVFVAIINQVGNYIFSRRKRKDDIEDKDDNTKTQIDNLRTETNTRFSEISTDINCLTDTVSEMVTRTDVIMKNSKAQAYDRIRHLGMTHIREGEISVDELRTLTELHESYKALGGDGFLDRLMGEVNNLRIKVE
jgi:hypothetical protein